MVTVTLELTRYTPRHWLHNWALPQNGFYWNFSLSMKVKIKSISCLGDNWMINSLSPQRADKQHPLYLSSDGLLLLIHLSPRLTLQAFQNVGKCPLEVLSAVLLLCSSSHIWIFCRKYFVGNIDIFRNILSVATGTVNQPSPPPKLNHDPR